MTAPLGTDWREAAKVAAGRGKTPAPSYCLSFRHETRIRAGGAEAESMAPGVNRRRFSPAADASAVAVNP